MRRLIVITSIALVAIGLAACGNDKEASGTDTSAAPTTTGTSGGQGGNGATAAGSEFCQQVGQIGEQYADAFKSVQQPQVDPSNPMAGMQQIQEVGQKLLEPMKQIQAIAPPEIKTDVDALVSGFEALASGSTEALATAGTQMGQAGTNFAQYLASNCAGTDLGGFGTGTGTGSGTGTGTGTGTGPS